MSTPVDPRKRRWFWIGFAVAGLAGVAGLSRLISVAIDKVMSGHGLDTYRTVWLVEFNYVGVLVSLRQSCWRCSSAAECGCTTGGNGAALKRNMASRTAAPDSASLTDAVQQRALRIRALTPIYAARIAPRRFSASAERMPATSFSASTGLSTRSKKPAASSFSRSTWVKAVIAIAGM